MKMLLLPILFLFNFQFCPAQLIAHDAPYDIHPLISGTRDLDLTGKVESIRETVKCMDTTWMECMHGSLLNSTYAKFDEAGQVVEHFINDTLLEKGTQYNKWDKLTEKDIFGPDGKLEGKMLYDYFDNGYLKGEKVLNVKDSNEQVIWETKLVYDRFWHLIEEREHGVFNLEIGDKEITHTYNEQGKLTEDDLDPGSRGSKKYYKYDSKGNLIETTLYLNTEKKITRWDEHRNKVDTVYTYKGQGIQDGGPIKSIYKYDHHQNIIEELDLKDGNTLLHKRTAIFKYDERGNWIEKRELSDGKLEMITERVIEYYK